MLINLFENILISPENIRKVALELKDFFADRQVTIRVTRFDGKVSIHQNLTLYPASYEMDIGNGIRVTDAKARSIKTNSAHLTLIFEAEDDSDPAFHFETADDPMVERISSDCIKIMRKRGGKAKDEKELIIAVE